MRYKSRKRPNARCRRGRRLGKELSLGRSLRRDIILERARSFTRKWNIRVLSLAQEMASKYWRWTSNNELCNFKMKQSSKKQKQNKA